MNLWKLSLDVRPVKSHAFRRLWGRGHVCGRRVSLAGLVTLSETLLILLGLKKFCMFAPPVSLIIVVLLNPKALLRERWRVGVVLVGLMACLKPSIFLHPRNENRQAFRG